VTFLAMLELVRCGRSASFRTKCGPITIEAAAVMDSASEQAVLEQVEEEPMDREEVKSVLESLLFVADGPLTVPRIAEVLAGVDKERFKRCCRRCKANSKRQAAGCNCGGGGRLSTAHGQDQRRLGEKISRRPAGAHGPATLETLAIIAYRQPITRAEIESIRGVDVDGVITTLLERNLIARWRVKTCPAPFLYGTTASFCSYSISKI